MELWELFLLALGLSMDAFAVSISNGLCYRNMGKKEAFFTALTFGIFQAVMPVLGYFAGRLFAGAISFLDHWIALILLGIIGGSMIYEALKDIRKPEACPQGKEFSLRVLLMQGIATSIDALAVGVSFAVMQINLAQSVSLIGVTTFVCCLIGALIGKKFGAMLGDKAKIFGGIILIGIGLKVFIEHILGLG